MLGIHVTIPIACFRKGLAREYLETEVLPPPATCYGFLLSLVGETDRARHVGCRVTAGVIGTTKTSVVLRTVWRIKDKSSAQGSGTNARPDYQQLLSGDSPKHPFIELVMWLDSSEETKSDVSLESRVKVALDPNLRHEISRFGGLSLGESTHLIDSVSVLNETNYLKLQTRHVRLFVAKSDGTMTLPVWVDHVGSRNTRYITGELALFEKITPRAEHLPMIQPN